MTIISLDQQDHKHKSQLAYFFDARANFRDIFIRKSDRLHALDGIRALSVLVVVCFHAALPALWVYKLDDLKAYLREFSLFEKWFFEGHYGVNAFFVLSGFLIGTMLMKEINRSKTINLKQFYLRRFLRLSPLYYFVLILAALIWTFSGEKNPNYLWFNVIYLNNYVVEAHDKMPWAWSLAIEEQFYLIFPLLLLLVFRCNNKLLILIAIYLSSYLVRALILLNNPDVSLNLVQLYFNESLGLQEEANLFRMHLYIPLWSRFGELLIGVLVAYLNLYHSEKLKILLQQNFLLNNFLLLLSCSTLIWLISVPVYDVDMKLSTEFLFFYNIINENLFALCIAVIICCVLYPSGLSHLLDKVLSAKFWYPIAQLSYAIYLLHPPFVYLGFLQASHGATLPSLGIYLQGTLTGLLVTLVFASITFTFIERPFMKMRNMKRTSTT